MTKQEIKKAREKIFSDYPQAVYINTDIINGDTMVLDDKMQKIANVNLFDYIKKGN